MFVIPGKLALAPMAGVTDRAFREICMDFGADYCVTEMVSAKAMQLHNKKTFAFAKICDKEQPAAIQLFGDDPSAMEYAAKELLEFHPYAIDINMGCPAPKIAQSGGGANLMREPKLCGEIVKAVVNAVNIPVTVKIRKGWDDNNVNAVEIAKICENSGACAITVHGRTRAQFYKGVVDYDIIRDVKNSVKIPIIGNGDIKDIKSALKMFNETGCDMLMIGRAARGNPWIFKELSAYFNNLPYKKPTLEEKMDVMRIHIEKICEYKGKSLGIKEARKHFAWYLSGLRGAAAFRNRAVELKSLNDLYPLIDDILEENKDES